MINTDSPTKGYFFRRGEPGVRPDGLYVHVPFCQRKCAYCDFFSITDISLTPVWLVALEKEASFYQGRFGSFDTLYIGGGTPSLLDTPQIAALMDGLRRYFSFLPDTEVTLEANPDDLTPEKIALYKDLGVNRLSLGVQSFHDRELAFLGRRHDVRQTLAALEAARAAGFNNLSLDLIYGLPGQSLEDWRRTLEQALAFNPEHLSCYQLTYEPETPLGRKKAHGKVTPATEEEERNFFLFTSRFLEDAGYEHYEISNFARLGEPRKDATPTLTLPPPGGGNSSAASRPNNAQFLAYEKFCPEFINNQESVNRKPHYSRHNRKYWHHTPYLGLGPGAHSFLEGVRWGNVTSVKQYCRELAQGRAPVADREVLSAEQFRLEALYLGLRTREGVSLDRLRQFPGWEKILHKFEKEGLLEVRQERAAPTRRGFLLADSLPLRFMDEGQEEEGMRYQDKNAFSSGP